MKKYIVLFVLFLFCNGGDKNFFVLKAQIPDSVAVGETFSLIHTGTNAKGGLDGVGYKVVYDSTKLTLYGYETFDIFQFEDVVLVNNLQGKVGVSFTGTSVISNLAEDTLLVLDFIVKENAIIGPTKIQLTEARALKDSKNIDFDYSQAAENEIVLKEYNLFILKSRVVITNAN